MHNNLLKLFGKLRRFDKNHPEEGFQVTPDGEKIRIERRESGRRKMPDRRFAPRESSIERRVRNLERRLGVDWRTWIK
ncbi:MAG: hypothetical protein ABII27_03845 [bacterium]